MVRDGEMMGKTIVIPISPWRSDVAGSYGKDRSSARALDTVPLRYRMAAVVLVVKGVYIVTPPAV